MTDWQPFDTAPKEIEILAAFGGERVTIVEFHTTKWRYQDGTEAHEGITHWTWLPDPPQK